MVEIKSCHTEVPLPVTAVSPTAAPQISPSGIPAPTLILLKNSQTTTSLLNRDDADFGYFAESRGAWLHTKTL